MKKKMIIAAAMFAALCLNSCDKNDPDTPIAGGTGNVLLLTALPNATGMDGTVYMQLIDEPKLGATMAVDNKNGINGFFRNLVEAQVAEDHFSFEQVKRCSPKHYSLYSF